MSGPAASANPLADLLTSMDALQIVPWMSAQRIAAGDRWRTDLNEALNSVSAGVVLLSIENYREPWVLYEAGWLDGRGIRVVPVLVDLPSDLLPRNFPLASQCVANTYEGILSLSQTLANCSGSRPDSHWLEFHFGKEWSNRRTALTYPYQARSDLCDRPSLSNVGVFCDIANASVDSICNALMLYTECSRIAVLTDWGQPSRTQADRNQLAAELDALRRMLRSVFAGPGRFETESAREIISLTHSTCLRVHEALERQLRKNPERAARGLVRAIKQHANLRSALLGAERDSTRSSRALDQVTAQIERVLGSLPSERSVAAPSEPVRHGR